MYRTALVATALGCLVGIASLARSADHHGHIHNNHLSKHLRATPNGTVSHGTIKGHTVSTHHARGKVKGVSVGSKGHGRAYKVRGTHRNSSRTHASLDRPSDRLYTLETRGGDDSSDLQFISARLPAASFICFLISFGGHNYFICLPIELVDVNALVISGGAPDGLDEGD
jgi:hypothetical protein